ncbi:MAG: multiprotein bridging factor aMBF1 [Candidatus Bathyarchaeota archaeon]|nr:multiprotein bridging factor aMBF1 [Candidatus Bathyarchaeota archaeon]
MRCEVCGRKIFGQPQRVLIEGAKLTVCYECSKHGKIIHEEPKPKTIAPKLSGKRQPLNIPVRSQPGIKIDTSIELVENYGEKIRQAREKLNLSHEDLGKKLNEKVSLLRKIETEKMRPNNTLASRLEHVLKVKLIVPASEEKISDAKIPKAVSREVTLGDLMKLNDGESKKETSGRKQS